MELLAKILYNINIYIIICFGRMVMIFYRDIQYSQISVVKDLWEKNRIYHEKLSKYFGDTYTNLIFEDRIKHFSNFDCNHMKITIAEDSEKLILGYCISTIDGIAAETHSLHVAEEARGLGIGKNLMNNHIEWMKNNNCTNIIIKVEYENSNTINFYNGLGFKENIIEMRLIND
jgi:ribosomal protein S18 acetylase RimI-like enzyme